MTYTAYDGTMLTSSSKPVIYSCDCSGIVDGIYESVETTGADTPIGIQQIKIKREVNNNVMTTTITESTEQELIDYLESLKTE